MEFWASPPPDRNAKQYHCDELRWGLRIIANHFRANLHRSFAEERWLAGDAFVQQPAQREQVAACIYFNAQRLLRRKIHGSADNHAFASLRIEPSLRFRIG